MVLNVDSDAAYLVLPRARIRLAGHFFLSSPGSPSRIAAPNGPVLTECKTIRHVVSSAATANAFIHQTMRHKRSKSWDMRYWWLKEKSAESEFQIFWDKGVNNWADYFTKHFAPAVHQVLRQRYVHRTNLVIKAVLQTLRNSLPARLC